MFVNGDALVRAILIVNGLALGLALLGAGVAVWLFRRRRDGSRRILWAGAALLLLAATALAALT